MKVLVTGGLGYVGSVLVPHLAKSHDVRVFDSMLFGNSIAGTPNVEFVQGDILDPYQVARALRGCEAIVHLAGIVTDDLVDLNPDYAKKVNEEATDQLCRLAVQAGARRLVYASSSSVYGSQPMVCGEQSPTYPETAYAETKLQAERICLSHTDRLEVVAMRSATCCGPAPRMRLDTIVNIFSKQAYFDREITVFDGTQYRSNIHVADVADFYQVLLEAPAKLINRHVFNAVRGFATAREIAELVQRKASDFGLDTPYIAYDSSKRDTRQYRMRGDIAELILGWKPKRSIENAVWQNFQWFRYGGLGEDPNADLYYNTRRMRDKVLSERA